MANIFRVKLLCVNSTFTSNFQYLSFKYGMTEADWYINIDYLVRKKIISILYPKPILCNVLALFGDGWGLPDPTVGITMIINLLFASETPPFVMFPKTILLVAISKIKHSISFASCISKSSKISKSKLCAYFT